MTRTRVENNGFNFWLGFLSFLAGISFFSLPLVTNNALVKFMPWELVVTWIFSSFFVCGGLVLLLKAGLGAFWNQEIIRRIGERENGSASEPIPGSVDPDDE